MYITFTIEETEDDYPHQKDSVEISQTCGKIIKGIDEYFPCRTTVEGYFIDDPRWSTILYHLITGIEKHFGYEIKDKISVDLPKIKKKKK